LIAPSAAGGTLPAMQLDFRWLGTQGTVDAECQINSDPAGLGCPPDAAGLPACAATVRFPHLGYRSMMGWVQLVRSTDNASGGAEFEPDPFALFGDAPSPYCWYGVNPSLFDGPSRPTRDDMEWVAHSFLAATPLDEVVAWKPRRLVPLAAFSWGFTISNTRVSVIPVAPLVVDAWNIHTSILRAHYPLWVFPDVEGGVDDHQ
jgi:hypothetical protein